MTKRCLLLGTIVPILILPIFFCGSFVGAQPRIWNTTLDTDVQLTFIPSNASLVTMYQTSILHINYTITCKPLIHGYVLYGKTETPHVARLQKTDIWYLHCSDTTRLQEGDAVQQNGTFNVTIEGIFVGKSLLSFTYREQTQPVFKADDERDRKVEVTSLTGEHVESDVITDIHHDATKSASNPHPILVLLPVSKYDHLFRIIVTCLVVLGMVSMGCKTDLKVVKKDLKRPLSPAVGLLCQYIGMPLIGFGIASLAPYQYPIMRFAIFCVGCCPGGGNSNFYAYLLGGDVSLSITMTTVSSFASFGLFPLWVKTLGQELLASASAEVEIPFINMFLSILTVVAPLTVGIFLGHKFPKASKIIVKIIIPFMVIGVIAASVVFFITSEYVFEILTGVEIVAGACLPHAGFLLGGLVAWITRHNWSRIKTIALEVGLQNFGVAMITITFSIPPPDSNLAIVAAVGAAMMTGALIMPVTVIYIIQKKVRERFYKKVPTEDEELKASAGSKQDI